MPHLVSAYKPSMYVPLGGGDLALFTKVIVFIVEIGLWVRKE